MIIRLKGGLGNQLFQYAYGKCNKCDGYDITWFDQFERDFELDKFRVDKKPFKKYETDLLDGYWQKYRYIEPILSELKTEIRLKDEFKSPKYLYLAEGISKVPSVAMHVRRDDYLKGKNLHKFYQLGVDYYDGAYNMMKGITSGFFLFIFSDDVAWCRENLRYQNSIYVDISGFEAFDLMRLCKHHIIANSTFSYWAAILSDGAVIAPKIWRNDPRVQANYTEGLMPDRFLKL